MDNDPDKLIRYSAGNGDISGVHDTMRTLEVSQSDAQFLNRTYQQV